MEGQHVEIGDLQELCAILRMQAQDWESRATYDLEPGDVEAARAPLRSHFRSRLNAFRTTTHGARRLIFRMRSYGARVGRSVVPGAPPTWAFWSSRAADLQTFTPSAVDSRPPPPPASSPRLNVQAAPERSSNLTTNRPAEGRQAQGAHEQSFAGAPTSR